MKTYRLQLLECSKNGTQFEVPCIHCSKINLICVKYKAYCNSSLCRDERMTAAEKAEFYKEQAKGNPKNKAFDKKVDKILKKKSKYCGCGNSPCMLKSTGCCVYCKKPIRPGVYY